MIGGISYASSQIASAYTSNSQQLADTLTRIASGKKFQNASEDLVGYIRSQKIQSDLNEYGSVRQSLTEFKTFSSAAVEIGSNVYGKLTEMKDLATKYAAAVVAADTDKQAQYSSEFSSLKTEVSSLLTNGKVDGKSVVGFVALTPVTTARVDPSGTTLSMQFSTNTTSTIVDGLSIAAAGAPATVQAEMTKVLTYMSEAKSYNGIADQQLKLTDTIVNSKKAVMSMITDIDDAEESNKAIDLSIRQQAAMSMMAQANMSRQSIMQLYS